MYVDAAFAFNVDCLIGVIFKKCVYKCFIIQSYVC